MDKNLIRVFVIEDNAVYSSLLKHALEKNEYCEVSVFSDAATFFNHLHENPDIVTIDYLLPDKSGIEVLREIRKYNKSISTIMLSGQDDVKVVVECYKNGADDYVVKNDNAIVELQQSIQRLTTNVNLRKEVETLKDQIIDRNKYSIFHGESKPLLKMLRLIQKVEKTNMLVMITGESGTGKELVASAIHYNSPRARKPFVKVNMAAIPHDLMESELFGHEKGAFTGADSKRIGKFEESNEGTIFLDEIGEMNMELQTKLLRVLQENKVTRLGSNKEIPLNVRVIAATNKNLAQQVREGKMRDDLYYRLQGFLIQLPQLRERGNDIIILAKHFLKEYCEKNNMAPKRFTPESVERLMAHNWAGNVRELKSLVERGALISDHDFVSPEDLVFSQDVLAM